MRTPDPDAAFAALRAAEPDVMDRDELASLTDADRGAQGVV